jgi:PAS domain S-box-containing protein
MRKVVLVNLFLMMSYVCAGNLSLVFKTFSLQTIPLWPPSGLALGLVLIFGMPYVIPGIILGVVFLAFQRDLSLITMMGLAFAGVLETVMASLLLHSTGKAGFKFKKPTDILIFMIIAALLSPFVSSTVQVFSLYIGGVFELEKIPYLWPSFFMGNSIGILVFTPFVLSLFNHKCRKISILEAAAVCILTFLVGHWAFEEEGVRRFLMLPLLTWAAFRFSFIGVSVATMILGGIAIWRSNYLWAVFSHVSPESDLLWIQCLTAGAALVGYLFATFVEVQEEAQHEVKINLRHKKIAEESLAILDQSINKSPIGFALIDKDYKYIRINETLAYLNGFPREYHLGKSVREIVPQGAPLVEKMIDKVFKTGKSYMNIKFHGAFFNQAYPISGQVSYYPIKHPLTNEIFSVGVTIQDMTEQIMVQSLLQEKQDFLTFAQEAGKIGSFEWDINTNRILWTPELENIFGLNQGEFGGYLESWLEWIHPEDVEMCIDVLNKVSAGESELNLQYRIVTKNMDIKWILARGKIVKEENNRKRKFIGISIDLTEQKSIEHKLRLTEANLRHALSVRDDFVAIASHELKTPLTALKLHNQLFQRGVERNDGKIYTPEKVQNLLGKNASHIDRLTRLVDDMLDISRIRTGKLSVRKEPCEISSMLLDVINRTKIQFEESGSGHPQILVLDKVEGEWDQLRIEQVMTNIITNAIRYGQGREISISLQDLGESVRFSVTDQGLGIAKSDHQKIFMRYERGLIAREIAGLGIGLFITQQIVLAHQGRIWVESEVSKGATFFVDLPIFRSIPSPVSPEHHHQKLVYI